MPNLIDSSLLWYSQPPLRIHRILFQEKSAAQKLSRFTQTRETHVHLITRRQKVLVSDMIIVPRRKLGLLAI